MAKASRRQAEKSLRQHVAGVCDLRFAVKFESDDGGNHICLYIEVDDPDSNLDPNPNQGGRQVPLPRLPAPLHAPQAEPPAERGHGALRTSDCRPLDRLLNSEAGPGAACGAV